MPQKIKGCDFKKMLFYFRDKMGLPGKATFSKAELSLILGLYGDRVKKGEWRDYALDHLPDMAVFSIYRSSKESPVYSICKIPSRSFLKPAQFVVNAGKETVKQSASLGDILEFFAEKT